MVSRNKSAMSVLSDYFSENGRGVPIATSFFKVFRLTFRTCVHVKRHSCFKMLVKGIKQTHVHILFETTRTFYLRLINDSHKGIISFIQFVKIRIDPLTTYIHTVALT